MIFITDMSSDLQKQFQYCQFGHTVLQKENKRIHCSLLDGNHRLQDTNLNMNLSIKELEIYSYLQVLNKN